MSKLSWGGTIVVVAMLTSSVIASDRQAEPAKEYRQLVQEMMPPTILLGKWRCEGSFQGSRVPSVLASLTSTLRATGSHPGPESSFRGRSHAGGES
jgi:hypothetical protein